MEISEFIKNFASQFEETDASKFTAQTRFRDDIEEWDSLKAMSVIAMMDIEYGVILKGNDFRNCLTIADLFNLVNSKK